jgi:DNA repair exonuclease SbcCD ATPase subunit
MNCAVCDTEIQDGDLKIAHCQHRFHNNCFLIEVCAKLHIARQVHCPSCTQPLFEENMVILQGIRNRIEQLDDEEDIMSEDSTTEDAPRRTSRETTKQEYRKLYATSEPFRKDMKKLKATIKEVRALKKAAAPIIKQKEAELKQKIDPLLQSIKYFVSMIRTTRANAIKDCRTHPQVKALLGKVSSLSKQYYATHKKYSGTIVLRWAVAGIRLHYYSPTARFRHRIRSNIRYI